MQLVGNYHKNHIAGGTRIISAYVSFEFANAVEYRHRYHEKRDEKSKAKLRTNLFGVTSEGSGQQNNFLFHQPGMSDPWYIMS